MRLPSRKLFALAALAVGCSAPATPDVPVRYVGLSDIVGQARCSSGSPELDQLSIEWTSAGVRETGREPECGVVTDIAADGSFRIEGLIYGTYLLRVHYGAGKPHEIRVRADEDQEQVAIELPTGRLHLQAAPGVVLDHVTLRAFGSTEPLLQRGANGSVPPEGVLACGLGAGRYAVDAVFEGGGTASTSLVLEDDVAEQQLVLQPSVREQVPAMLRGGMPHFAKDGRLVFESYGRAPDDRLFDFGALRASSRLDANSPFGLIGLPPGESGLLVLLREGRMPTTTALIAWLPDLHVEPGAEASVRLGVPKLRQVRVTRPSGKSASPKSWSVRIGEDALPAQLLYDDASIADQAVWLPVGAKVLSGNAHRTGAAEGDGVTVVKKGGGVQVVTLAN
jgi:hypothetical protein